MKTQLHTHETNGSSRRLSTLESAGLALKRLLRTSWELMALLVALVAALLGIAYLISGNTAATFLVSLLIAVLTTIVSVIATRQEARRSFEDTLTQYGRQAWTSLERLEEKVRKRLENDEHVDNVTLDDWALDIAHAKDVWRDLLEKDLDKTDRIQEQLEKTGQEFEQKLREVQSNSEWMRLHTQLQQKVERLAKRAPLPTRPVKVNVTVSCPNCDDNVEAELGISGGESAWPTCLQCGYRFPIHRLADGSVRVSNTAQRTSARYGCPSESCDAEIVLDVPKSGSVAFIKQCQACGTHVQFRGSHEKPYVTNLGRFNSEFICPHCSISDEVFIAPGRHVRFLHKCRHCCVQVQIEGMLGDFTARPPQTTTTDLSEADAGTLATWAAMALAEGDFPRAKRLYELSRERGLSTVFALLDLAMVDLAEGDADAARSKLEEIDLAKAGPGMKVQIHALRSLGAAATNSLNGELDDLRTALDEFPEFSLDRSGLKFLGDGFIASHQMTPQRSRVFACLRDPQLLISTSNGQAEDHSDQQECSAGDPDGPPSEC
jgi:hypothetical protein